MSQTQSTEVDELEITPVQRGVKANLGYHMVGDTHMLNAFGLIREAALNVGAYIGGHFLKKKLAPNVSLFKGKADPAQIKKMFGGRD